MWAIIPFFSALALLGAFFGFRAWEMKRGTRLFDTFRAKIDVYASRAYATMVTGQIPPAWRITIVVVLHNVVHRAVVFSVETLRNIERPLTRLSHRLRTRAPSANGHEVSPFLKNIVPNKKADTHNGTTPPSGV